MGRRKRNKSSPGQKQITKKYKFAPLSAARDTDSEFLTDREGEGTDYFDTLESDSENKNSSLPPTPLYTMNLSQSDIEELCAKLAPTLIKNLKAALREEVIKDLKHELSDIVKVQTQEMREEMISLKHEVQTLKSELKKALLDDDELSQYGRRMCLDVSGIQGDEGKADENVEAKLLKLVNKAGLGLKHSDIDKCHRKGKPADNYNRKIIVKFTNSKARDRVYNARKNLGDGLFIQENLTPYREYLGYEARQLKRDDIITKTWVAGCKIYVQVKGETKGKQLKHIDDINLIKENRKF